MEPQQAFALVIVLVIVFMCRPKKSKIKGNDLKILQNQYKAKKFEEVENN